MAGITRMITADEALPGRVEPLVISGTHLVLGTSFLPPFPDDVVAATFATGCFWCIEETFWQTPGVYSTAVGYTGGFTPNPTYEEVCTGYTGHAESVVVLFRPEQVGYETLLRIFWEHHDPTQGMRQGNDVGTEYRSAIFVHDESQRAAADASRAMFQERLTAAGYGTITTEVADAGPFYYAEEIHQQYLAKYPWGYRGQGGTGVACPLGPRV